MVEPFFISTTLFLAWGWLGFFWTVGWLVLSIARERTDKRDRAFIKGLPWDEFPLGDRSRVSRRWRKDRWRGLKHYVVGLLLLGIAWLASIAFLLPAG